MITKFRYAIAWPLITLGKCLFAIAVVVGCVGSIIRRGFAETLKRLEKMVATLKALKEDK